LWIASSPLPSFAVASMSAPAADKPKRPPSSYWLWLNENREAITKEVGPGKITEVTKRGGEKWRALTAEEKAPYEERANKLKEEYEANKPAKPEKVVDPNFRKKPMTPVFAFIQEKRVEIAAAGATSLGEISKKGAELFKLLPDAEKAERTKKYEDELKAYNEWKVSEEGSAVFNSVRAAKREESAAKRTKIANRDAKLARKEGRELPSDEKPSAEPSKRKSAGGTETETPAKRASSGGRGRGRGATPAVQQPNLDEKIVQEAQSLGLEASLKNLAARKDVIDSGKTAKDMLEALKVSKGLVNNARRALLGA